MEKENVHRQIMASAEAYSRNDADAVASAREETPELYVAALKDVVLRDSGGVFGARGAEQLRRRAALELLQEAPSPWTFGVLADYPDPEIAERAQNLLRLMEDAKQAYVASGIAELEVMLGASDETETDENPAE
jgi:hypothetical protein